MRLIADGRLAWALALAAALLWAVAAPATLGSFAGQEGGPTDTPTPAIQTADAAEGGSTPERQPQTTSSPVNPIVPQAAGELQCQPAQTPEPIAATNGPATSNQPSSLEATFRLCPGGPDPQAERAIEQLINGRSFKARLVSRTDGCADLTIAVPSQSSAGSFIGRQSTNLSVATGSGSIGGVISVQIVTENGVTRAAVNEPLPGPTATPTPTTVVPAPTATPTAQPAAQSPSASSSGGQATFRLCGGPDPRAERAIEQLINGRSFNARLVSGSDGCADLTITVSPQSSSAPSSGSQSTQLNISSGSGGGVSLQIVTENGVTKAKIGAAR